jgi:ubiquitin-protein ligase E3 C
MFGKGSFEGQFRSTPTVSIGGSSKNENREQLLVRARQERSLREAKRQESGAAVRIQALVRGYQTRRRQRGKSREELNSLYQELAVSSAVPDLPSLRTAGVLLLASWETGGGTQRDHQVFSWYCQQVVRQRQLVLGLLLEGDAAWLSLMCRLLSLAVAHLANSTENVTSSLRLLEIFTSPSSYPADQGALVTKIYKHLLDKEYFSRIRILIDCKIPPLLEETLQPPTPVSGEILQMLLRPLQVVGSLQDRGMVSKILAQFSNHILSSPFSDQVRLFILPSLSLSGNVPFYRLCDLLTTQASVPRTPCLLYSFLSLSQQGVLSLSPGEEETFLSALASLSQVLGTTQGRGVGEDDDDSDTESLTGEDMKMDEGNVSIVDQSIRFLNNQEFVTSLTAFVDSPDTSSGTLSDGNLSFGTGTTGLVTGSRDLVSGEKIRYLCIVCHALLMHRTDALHQYCLLYTLAFRPRFLHQLWTLITSTTQPSLFGSPTPLLTLLARGVKMSSLERDQIAPSLAVFSSLFGYLLVTIHDTEFYNSQTNRQQNSGSKKAPDVSWMPFRLSELVAMSQSLRDVALGLVELAFPESRPSVREDYKMAVNRQETEDSEVDVLVWSHMFRSVVGIVRQLHSRDNRRQFCPDNHWINPRLSLPLDRPHDISFRRSRIRQYRPFRGLRVFTREELEEKGPPLSTKEVRLATVLRELPFTISFSQRVIVFQNLIQRDKEEHQGHQVNFMQGPAINLLVRRNYIYEDAFEKLSRENEPNLRLKMRVQLVNAAGLDEAGIDGGGLFREFLSQLLKAAFDPNRGFLSVTRNQMLYPNPNASYIHENSSEHYYFIGRMLGKALYENMLVELPLATFFLSKLLGGQSLVNVDIDHLDSLDPELYKNLLYLKTYDGDVQDLGLDFTMVVEDFGETRVELLKPDGDQVAVTNENRIEYIHLVADYKLNRQIKQQCAAFRSGLADVIGLDWLRMFSSRELRTLISGAEHEISVSDLQAHTNYSGGFEPTHATILAFWQVVGGMGEDQKRSLLKFVTSCSRPPLLGFKDLDPPFCIHNAGSEPNRLPTASTCMNLLKLPDFKDVVVLKNKLLYAIESGAGFELS